MYNEYYFSHERDYHAIKAQVLQSQLHQRDDEVKNLKTDVDVLGNQLAEALEALRDPLLKLDTLASREESLEHQYNFIFYSAGKYLLIFISNPSGKR
jgi:hypothetical protein